MVVAINVGKSKPAWPFQSDSATLGIINLATAALKRASAGRQAQILRWPCAYGQVYATKMPCLPGV